MIDELLALAAADSPNRWPLQGRDIATARNKHRTNTPQELRDGLTGPYDWFEADVRMHDGRPIAAHDRGATDGLWMEDWFRIGATAQRGLKIDFKVNAAIEPVVELIQKYEIPDERLILNVPILGKPGESLTHLQLARLRTAFPNAIINLSISTVPYSKDVMAASLAAARAAGGGPVMFPLNALYTTRDVVATLSAGGRIAIWNNPATWRPGDIAKATATFRSWSVDGMIDLRNR